MISIGMNILSAQSIRHARPRNVPPEVNKVLFGAELGTSWASIFMI